MPKLTKPANTYKNLILNLITLISVGRDFRHCICNGTPNDPRFANRFKQPV